MKFILANKGISIFIALSVIFVVLVSKYAPSPRLTYDSQAYIEASQSIGVYFYGKNADGYTYLFRPPVIPLYLHFFEDKILAAKWLNAICFVLSLWLCYFIGRELDFEALFLSLYVASVVASYPWLQNHFLVWSEPLFGTLLLLLVWLMLREGSWIWISFLCTLLFLTRKVGLFVSMAVVVEYLFRGDRHKAARIGLTQAAVFTFWELLSFFCSGHNVPKLLFLDLVGESRWHWLDAVTAWFIPRNVGLPVRAIIIVAFASSVVLLLKKQLTLTKQLKAVMRLGLIYLVIFVVFLGVAEFGEADRYLSVVIPLVMLVVTSILRALCLRQDTKRYWLLFFFLWMTYPIGRTIYHLLLS